MTVLQRLISYNAKATNVMPNIENVVGRVVRARRMEASLSIATLSSTTDIALDRLEAIEEGRLRATGAELIALAKSLSRIG